MKWVQQTWHPGDKSGTLLQISRPTLDFCLKFCTLFLICVELLIRAPSKNIYQGSRDCCCLGFAVCYLFWHPLLAELFTFVKPSHSWGRSLHYYSSLCRAQGCIWGSQMKMPKWISGLHTAVHTHPVRDLQSTFQ